MLRIHKCCMALKINKMKNILIVALLLLSFNLSAQDEISLFNSDGEATAYIDTEDDDLTIYLWGGKPVRISIRKAENFTSTDLMELI